MNGLSIAFDFPGSFSELETNVSYNGETISVFNGTKGYSHHLKARTDKLGFEDTFSSASAFLGELCWFHDLEISILTCVQGSGRPTTSAPSKLDRREVCHFDGFVQQINNERGHLALAFYREGFSSPSPFYRFLSYYKILEVPFDGLERKKWMSLVSPRLATNKSIIPILRTRLACDPYAWIYETARHGLAHGNAHSDKPQINPNSYKDWQNIVWASELIKEFAELCLVEVLKVPSK